MERENQVEKFFKQLAEEAKKRQERINKLKLIEVWNHLSPNRKKDFTERIFDLAECFDRSQKEEDLKNECLKIGHDYEPWTKSNTEGDYWYRKCKRCGLIEHTRIMPKEKIKKRFIFKIKKP